jgi:MoxR-like ATPase
MLRDLACDAGMAYADTGRANDADLISVYRVALTNPEGATRTAQKILERIHGGRAPTAPQPTPTAPQPTAPGVTQGDLQTAMNALLDGIKADIADVHASLAPAIAAQAAIAAQEAVKALTPMRLDVSVNGAAPVALGVAHEATPRILRYLARKRNVYLHGPAGSGKTTVGKMCADALGLEFYMNGRLEDQYGLLGFMGPNGYMRTPFRDAVEFGGLFMFDEFDRSGPGAPSCVNSTLANRYCAFPDKLVYCHPDFRVIAAGNTTMRGASGVYSDAQQVDGSVIDRFAFIEFGYDLALEDAISPNKDWLAWVRAVRAEAANRCPDLIVSPRASVVGSEAIADGETWAEVAETELFKGLDPATVKSLMDATRRAWKG